jgi:ADP-heptose:LPS heptosyltransferase
MGDVAMTVPVLRELLLQNPGLKITVVSNEKFAPFFSEINQLSFFPVQLTGRHKGFKGLLTLFADLKKVTHVDAIADLHNVLRTQLLRFLFSFSGIKMEKIDKGRSGKKKLTRQTNKILQQLPTTFQRYETVFKNLGLQLKLPLTSFHFKKKSGGFKIGIAPFAKHQEKMLPIGKMEDVIAELVKNEQAEVYLFGAKGEESTILENIAASSSQIHNYAGQFSLQEEMNAIANLDLMISMDSANMHIASLMNVPVISIWGSTHPFAGFLGWGQSSEHCVQINLPCRPCSVFGNKPCYRGDLACLNGITTQQIIQQVKYLY